VTVIFRNVVQRGLSAEDWRNVLRRFAERLPPGKKWRITVIGGVAMVLGYGARRTTTDADVVDTDPEILIAASRVAAELGLPPDWMNKKAEEAGYVVPSATVDARTVLETASLEVRVPSTAHMLAMKVARFAGETDIADARLLLGLLGGFPSVIDLWTLVGGLVPPAHRAQAKHNLEVLWEAVHESA
jgi:hypothetical protein